MDLCSDPAIQNIAYLVGIVFAAIRIAVPIILIVIGMVEMVRGITSQDEKVLKQAQSGLVKKAVAALIVFLIVSIVGLLMRIIGGDEYKSCMKCVTNFTDCELRTEVE